MERRRKTKMMMMMMGVELKFNW